MKNLILIALVILPAMARAEDRGIEYHEYLKQQAGSKEFITYNRPAWTREDMEIRKHAVSAWYKIGAEKLPELDNKQYVFNDKESVSTRFNDLVDDRDYQRKVAHINELARYHRGR